MIRLRTCIVALVTPLLVTGCSTTARDQNAQLEYRLEGEPTFHPYDGRRIPSPEGHPNIEIKIIPSSLHREGDAISISEDQHVVAVEQDGASLKRGKFPVYLLRQRGSPVIARYAMKRRTFGPFSARFGDSVRLVDEVVEEHLVSTLASLALMLVGLALGATGVVRVYARGYAWLGLFALAMGALNLSINPFRAYLIARFGHWPYVTTICVFLYVFAYGRFYLAMLGRDTAIQVGTLLTAGAFVAAIPLDLAGLVPIASTRSIAYFLGLGGLVRVVWLVIDRSRRGDQQARNLAVHLGTIIVFASPDLLGALNLIPAIPPFAEFGVLSSILVLVPLVERGYETQRIALEQTRSALVKQVDELTVQGSEIRALNTELRHQIAEHSRQLGRMFVNDDSATTEEIREGALFAERYRLLRRLGAGGMGEVFETERTSDKKRFALKVMLNVSSAVEAARFAREAEISASFDHRHLVSVFDAGLFQGRLFLVMELIEGGGLDHHEDRYGDASWALPILEQVASGLAVLHEHGVVHRDLKPGNVLLALKGDGSFTAKISDFGIARAAERTSPVGPEEAQTPPGSRLIDPAALDTTAQANHAPELAEASTLRADADGVSSAEALAATQLPNDEGVTKKKIRLTATGGLIGTPLYMPPEAATARRDVGTEGDIYAFGVLAYELLVGRLPFATPPVMLAMVGAAIPPPTPIENQMVSLEIRNLLARCLETDPSRRPTAAALRDAIERANAEILATSC